MADDNNTNASSSPLDTTDKTNTAPSAASVDGVTDDTAVKPDTPHDALKDKKKKKAPSKKRKKKTTKQLLIGLLIKIGVIVLTVWLLLTFVLGFTIHYGNNMYPSVRDGDLVVSFRLQRPYINAAVLYEHEGKTKVGRVIALEGNTVAISDSGEMTVNGIIPSEEVFYPTYPAEGSDIQFPYTVEPGKVFILNDFRSDTLDSRSFGAVDVRDVDGPILMMLRRRGF